MTTLTTYENYLCWNYEKLEAEYIKQGFTSAASFLLAKKQEQLIKPNVNQPITKHTKNNKHIVKVSDVKKGSVVGFTKEGYSIVATKKVTKGITSIFYCLQDPALYTPHFTRAFADVKTMVAEINTIIDVEKTEELAWW